MEKLHHQPSQRIIGSCICMNIFFVVLAQPDLHPVHPIRTVSRLPKLASLGGLVLLSLNGQAHSHSHASCTQCALCHYLDHCLHPLSPPPRLPRPSWHSCSHQHLHVAISVCLFYGDLFDSFWSMTWCCHKKLYPELSV